MHQEVARQLKIKKSHRVLDAGCGQGHVAVYLAKQHQCHVDGITVVPFEVDEVIKRAKKHQVLSNITCTLMDYSNTTFDDNIFDRIYTTETLSHAKDIRKTLHEFKRVLRKHGRVAFFEYTIAEDKQFSENELRILRRIAAGSAMAGLFAFRHDTFEKTLRSTGFRNCSAKNISKNVQPSLARLRRYALIPYCVLVKPFGLQKQFPNVSAAVEMYKLAKKDLVRYVIFTATKPTSQQSRAEGS